MSEVCTCDRPMVVRKDGMYPYCSICGAWWDPKCGSREEHNAPMSSDPTIDALRKRWARNNARRRAGNARSAG